jgi:hypothetical protein
MLKQMKELRADGESWSIATSSPPQLPIPPMVPTPPKVWSPPSLAWVCSPPSTTPTSYVLPLTLASPVAPPNLNKPLPPLPPTAESTPLPLSQTWDLLSTLLSMCPPKKPHHLTHILLLLLGWYYSLYCSYIIRAVIIGCYLTSLDFSHHLESALILNPLQGLALCIEDGAP